jgi:hypothetical protein
MAVRQRLAARMLRSVLAGALALLAGSSCDVPTAPLPDNAELIEPLPEYREWWEEIERCSGRRGVFEAVSWYVVRTPEPGFDFGGRYVAAVWTTPGNRILLAEHYVDKPLIVRHEMLHAVLHTGGHPTIYYEERCGDLVDQSY